MAAWVGTMGSRTYLVPDLAIPLDDFRLRGGLIERKAPAHVPTPDEIRKVTPAELEVPKPKRKRKA